MDDPSDVARLRTGQVELRVQGMQLRLDPDDACQLARQILMHLGWDSTVQTGMGIDQTPPLAMSDFQIRDTLERLRASGKNHDVALLQRAQISAPWVPASLQPTETPARPRERRFTKETAVKPKTAPKPTPARRDPSPRRAAGSGIETVLFDDPEQQLRYEVRHAYLLSVPVNQREQWPLSEDYAILPTFLDDVSEQGKHISRQQIISVIVDVVSSRVNDVPSRQVHPLRSGRSNTAHSNDPIILRRRDQAQAWRAAVSTATPAARRIMWWRAPTGRIELARLTVHDDFEMPER